MEAEGILQRQPAGTGYELTELGREVKRHGSQKQYYDYIINRDNAIFENVKWAKETSRHTKNTMWIIAFYTLVTLGIFITGMITCNQKNLPQTNQTKHPNSTKEIKASKITDTVK